VDKSNHRIVRLNIDQSTLTHIAGNPNGTFGQDNSSLYYPNDIYIDSSTNIYIADTNNHRIQEWDKDSTQGVTIFGTGFYFKAFFLKQICFFKDLLVQLSLN
jgi:hypothetical protein